MGQFSAIETHELLMHMTGINFTGLVLRERTQTTSEQMLCDSISMKFYSKQNECVLIEIRSMLT